jgi:hypothetical protein
MDRSVTRINNAGSGMVKKASFFNAARIFLDVFLDVFPDALPGLMPVYQ